MPMPMSAIADMVKMTMLTMRTTRAVVLLQKTTIACTGKQSPSPPLEAATVVSCERVKAASNVNVMLAVLHHKCNQFDANEGNNDGLIID